MKVIQSKIMVGALGLALAINVNAQTSPYLSISQNPLSSIQISWTNQVGTSYRILSTSNLTVPRSLWVPLEDAFSSSSNLAVSLSSTGSSVGFFAVEIPTNSGVQVFSPTNGQTVSGTIAIGVGAQIGTQIQGANLYLDSALIGVIDSGGIEFDLDTTHFANGSHTLYASAVDTANNETPSSPITLNFQNSVQWLDANSLFQSFVPITVQSSVFPANWTVFVANTNGTIIRTFSGSTSDGNIQTNWDGNDNNGIYAPDQTSYTITVVVTPSGSGGPSMANSSSVATSSGLYLVSASPNRYGVMEYEVEEPVLDPMMEYSNLLQSYLQMPEDERIIFPPFAFLTNEPSAPITEKLSAYDMFMLQHPTTNPSSSNSMEPLDDGAGGNDGSTSTTVWREAAWNSGVIVLARQNLGSGEIIYGGIVNSMFENIVTWVTADDTGNRGVFQGNFSVLNNSGDFTTLTNNLTSMSNPNVRALYLYAHGSPDGNSLGGYVRASDLGAVLGNSYTPARNGQPALVKTYHPFSFVFLDGCMTAKGTFPDAFGIPRAVSGGTYLFNNVHKRAFMGWGGITSNSILNNDFLDWSLDFWNTWIGTSTSIPLSQAINQASSDYPGVQSSAPMLPYGTQVLTWSN